MQSDDGVQNCQMLGTGNTPGKSMNDGGWDRNRTGVRGVAVRCITILLPSRVVAFKRTRMIAMGQSSVNRCSLPGWFAIHARQPATGLITRGVSLAEAGLWGYIRAVNSHQAITINQRYRPLEGSQ